METFLVNQFSYIFFAMRFTLLTISIVLILSYGCRRSPEKSFSNKKVILKEVAIAKGLDHPLALKILNDHIFIHDFYADYAFHVYSLIDLQQMGTLVGHRRDNETVVHFSFFFDGEDSLIYKTSDSVFFFKPPERR